MRLDGIVKWAAIGAIAPAALSRQASSLNTIPKPLQSLPAMLA
jgi:hypothetical protein